MGEDWTVRIRKGKPLARGRPHAAWYVRITDPSQGWVVDVELDADRNALSVSVRRRDGSPVTGRDVRRSPLSSYVKAARAAVAPEVLLSTLPARIPGAAEAKARVKEAMPKGSPQRGRSERWYLDLLRTVRALEAQGEPYPAKVIARRKRVPANRVYQWLHQARKIESRNERKGKS